MAAIILGLTLLSLIIWLGLLSFWGQFWRTDQQLESRNTTFNISTQSFPTVCAIIPARDEADLLPITLRSLLLQDYPGTLNVLLVDDRSTDGTAACAEGVAYAIDKSQQLHIISGETLPSGWSGKLWAVEQGIKTATESLPAPEYFFLTDADIEHDISNLRRLVAKAIQEDLDLVSVMVRLRCESFWEKLLIPAFVFFFQKLYPFRWVNNPNNPIAAAAGGCILIRKDALEQIGGIQTIRQTLIDDCALAKAVKEKGRGENTGTRGEGTRGRGDAGTRGRGDAGTRGRGDAGRGEDAGTRGRGDAEKISPTSPVGERSRTTSPKKGRIWLGLSTMTRSLRAYDSLMTIWDMVARTAYTQLNYSPLLLLGTLIGMTLIYLVPPMSIIFGLLTGNWAIALTGLSAWLLMTLAYFPTTRFYQLSFGWAFCLSAIAFLYTLMTLDSALRHWQGRGGAWKGRVYNTQC
jgi:hypothetical protein